MVRNLTGRQGKTPRLMTPDPADMAAMYRDVFETDRRGVAILEDLLARFGRTRVVVNGGIDAVLMTYRSAAHRELLDYIVARVNAGNGVDDPPPEGD
jgi:hypothetical protein